jgi:hypothetical protein
MTVYLKSGIRFSPSSEDALQLHKVLPVGNYIVREDPRTGELFLELVESFKPHQGTVYGDLGKKAERFVNTFRSRTGSTGVMLVGEKGSGKSLLARSMSILCALEDIPTIIINTQFYGDKFNKFIQDIEQECAILFDEFEKVYESENQEKILTLMDGVFPSKKLFILTCNDRSRVDRHLQNRPGRMYYMIEFSGLEASFVETFCNENLIESLRHHTNEIKHVVSLFNTFNFDMLKALVEEMNRYNEEPHAALEYLNIRPETGDDSPFAVSIYNQDGALMKDCTWYHRGRYEGSPLSQHSITFQVMPAGRKAANDECGEDSDEGSKTVTFRINDLKNASSDSFTFVNSEGYRVELVRIRNERKDFRSIAF